MALVLNSNVSSTGMTDKAINALVANYPTVYTATKNAVGDVELVNKLSPTGVEEVLRRGFRRIKNIYSGSGINPENQAPNTSGRQIFYGNYQIWSITDDADPNYLVLLPVQKHSVIKFPDHELITAAVIRSNLIERDSGQLYEMADDGTTVVDVLPGMMKGGIKPSRI